MPKTTWRGRLNRPVVGLTAFLVVFWAVVLFALTGGRTADVALVSGAVAYTITHLTRHP